MSARMMPIGRCLILLAPAATLFLAARAWTPAGLAEPAASGPRGGHARRLAATAGAEDGELRHDVALKDALRRPAAIPKSSGPPFTMRCDDLSLVLDGFGGFGSASAGGDAFFNAGSGPRATVFEAMAHLRGAGFLDADSLVLPQSAAGAMRDGEAATASYVRGPFRFDLRSELVDCGPQAATLQQQWTITNVSTRAQNLGFTSYVDGDLFFAGDHRDDHGVLADGRLWQFDQHAATQPAAYLELASDAPAALQVIRQVGEYSDQRRRINRNELLREGLFRSTGANADADGDGITDAGFDVSLAIAHEFGLVEPGTTVAVTTRLSWGVARFGDVLPSPIAVDLGPDRVVECEGQEGTLVSLGADVAGEVAAWEWAVDGVPAPGGDVLEALLAPGIHEVTLTVVDAAGASASDSLLVTVQDTVAPEATVLGELELWPPDHRLVPVDVRALIAARDACSETVEVRVLSVEADEPDDVGRGGDGMFEQDAVVIGGQAWLRRERQGGGNDRVYTLSCEVRDAAGNATPIRVIARVPHDRGGR